MPDKDEGNENPGGAKKTPSELEILSRNLTTMNLNFSKTLHDLNVACMSTQNQVAKLILDMDILKRSSAGSTTIPVTTVVTSTGASTSSTTTHSSGTTTTTTASTSIPIPSFSFDSHSMSIPQYNPRKMTPEHFIEEVTEYFHLRGVPSHTWLMLIFRMFFPDSASARWWREVKSSVHSWDEFTKEFIHYESSSVNKDSLLEELFQKKQKYSEAFETFAWDVSNLHQRINPGASKVEIIDRIVNSCLPEVSVYLRQSACTTISELNSKAREVIADLNKIRKFDRKSLLRARETDPVITFDNKPPHLWRRPSSHYNAFNKQSGEKETQPTLTSSDSSPPSTSSPTSKSQSTPQIKTCKYCKNPGHDISECRKKKYRDSQTASSSNTKQDSTLATLSNPTPTSGN
jgi:hypothetical protein